MAIPIELHPPQAVHQNDARICFKRMKLILAFINAYFIHLAKAILLLSMYHWLFLVLKVIAGLFLIAFIMFFVVLYFHPQYLDQITCFLTIIIVIFFLVLGYNVWIVNRLQKDYLVYFFFYTSYFFWKAL